MPHKLLIIHLLVLLCTAGAVAAQQPADAARTEAAILLDRTATAPISLFTGAEYIRTYPNVSGHPFLAQDSLQPGTLTYKGIFFPHVRLNLDVVRSEVVVAGPGTYWIRLVPEHIDSFSIASRKFRYLSGKEPYHPREGFYEVLHDGAMLVLAAHVKRIVTGFREDEASRFNRLLSYYIVVDGSIKKINSQAALIQAFGNKKSSIRKELQRQGLNFRQKPEESLLQAARLYEQTNK